MRRKINIAGVLAVATLAVAGLFPVTARAQNAQNTAYWVQYNINVANGTFDTAVPCGSQTCYDAPTFSPLTFMGLDLSTNQNDVTIVSPNPVPSVTFSQNYFY